MARESNPCVLIQAGMEATVSVKTYSNMLAVNLMLAYQLCGQNVEQLRREMLESIVQMRLPIFTGLGSPTRKDGSLAG